MLRLRALLAGMLLSLLAVSTLAVWGERREAQAALEDMGQEQATLSQAAASALASSLKDQPPSGIPSEASFQSLQRLERPGAVHVFLLPPGGRDFLSLSGQSLAAEPLRGSLDAGLRWVRLDRPQAQSLGLPSRTAIAGLAWAEGPGGRWGVVVAATAYKERDRAARAAWRLVTTLVLMTVIIGVFGALALRIQAEELQLARELEQKDREQLKDSALSQADRAATMLTFAAGVAHEISSPLGVIAGRAEQLLARDEARDRRELQAIREASDRIGRTVRRFLDLARGGEPKVEDVDPRLLGLSAAGMVAHRFQKSGVALSAELPEGLPPLRGDGSLLEQVLVNLLLNACDACEPGRSVVLSAAAGGGWLRFQVDDEGHGVPRDIAARITEPFFTTKSQGRGSGLGLAIAQEILKMHRGTLAVEPRAEGGTRAVASLPVS